MSCTSGARSLCPGAFRHRVGRVSRDERARFLDFRRRSPRSGTVRSAPEGAPGRRPYKLLAPKVSQAETVPCWSPRVNQR
jgi:hypothetical protein